MRRSLAKLQQASLIAIKRAANDLTQALDFKEPIHEDEAIAPHLRRLITLPDVAAAGAELDLRASARKTKHLGALAASLTLRSIFNQTGRMHFEFSVCAPR